MSTEAVLAIQDIGQDVVTLAAIAALLFAALAYRKQARIAAPQKEAVQPQADVAEQAAASGGNRAAEEIAARREAA